MIICTQCGAQQPKDDMKFCSNCGAPITPADGSAQPTVPAQDEVGQPATPEPAAPVSAQQVAVPDAVAPVAPTALPAKSWYENTYVRIALAIVGVILVVVGVSRIVNGLSGNSGNQGGSPVPPCLAPRFRQVL